MATFLPVPISTFPLYSAWTKTYQGDPCDLIKNLFWDSVLLLVDSSIIPISTRWPLPTFSRSPLKTIVTDSIAWTGTTRCISRRRSKWFWLVLRLVAKGQGFAVLAAAAAVDWPRLHSGHLTQPEWLTRVPENFRFLGHRRHRVLVSNRAIDWPTIVAAGTGDWPLPLQRLHYDAGKWVIVVVAVAVVAWSRRLPAGCCQTCACPDYTLGVWTCNGCAGCRCECRWRGTTDTRTGRENGRDSGFVCEWPLFRTACNDADCSRPRAVQM